MKLLMFRPKRHARATVPAWWPAIDLKNTGAVSAPYQAIQRRLAPPPPRSFAPIASGLAGAVLGGGLMYLFDPEKGHRRRALGRDKMVSAATQSVKGGRSAAIDFRNRAKGWFHELRARRSEEPVSSDVLVARIWGHAGGAMSHPGAIEISAEEDGSVRLKGHVLANEVDDILHAVSRVPGVSKIENQMEVHQSAEGIPSLRGPERHSSARAREHSYWSPSTRMAAGIAGAALVAYGGSRRRLIGSVLTGVGGALLVRSLSNTELSQFFGIRRSRHVVDIHKTMEIAKPIGDVFSLWSNFERLGAALEHVYSVQDLGHGRVQWKIVGPGRTPITYHTCITRMVPNESIAWKTEPGSPVAGAGVIRFQPLGNGATRVNIQMSYNPPGGMLGHLAARVTGTDPRSAMDDDLIRVKSLLETGKTGAHGEPVFSETDGAGRNQS